MNPVTPPRSAPRTTPTASGDDPRVRAAPQPADRHVETEEGDHPVRLDERHRVAEEAQQRPDREVDVARHDDQDHARRHDGDRRALDREVPQVPGGQEVAPRPDVEGDPDDDQRDHHAEQPGVELRGGQRRPPRARRRRRGGRRARRPDGRRLVRRSNLSHASTPPVREVTTVHAVRRGRCPNRRSPASAAHGDGAGFDALAERRLVDPPGVEDDVEVVLGDRDRLEQDRGELVAPRAR